MAMNKKEKKIVEDLKIKCALRWTNAISPDVDPPDRNSPFGTLSTGYLFNSYSHVVSPGCSSTISHGRGRMDKTSTQGKVSLYSTKSLALKAMRHEVEKDCARKLREIDIRIEAEEGLEVE